jgi:16S rRNA (cytidine1402-2'-O)-methyltransferase
MTKGTLHLISTPIGPPGPVLAPYIAELLSRIPYIIVENEKTCKRVLASIIGYDALNGKTFEVLDEHTKMETLPSLLEGLDRGTDGALLSEAGSPCVADPGAGLVALAHRRGIRVVPHPGPSSIIQALMASGLNGQRFLFEGYLPIKDGERRRRIVELEKLSLSQKMSVAFIETPYRIQTLMGALLATLRADTQLCVASGLMTEEEWIYTDTVGRWKQKPLELPKNPTVFIFQG